MMTVKKSIAEFEADYAASAQKNNDFVLITQNLEVLAAYEKIKANESYPNFSEETKQLRKENFIQY